MLEQLEPPTNSLRVTELKELRRQSHDFAHTLAIAYRRCPRNREILNASRTVKQLIARIDAALESR